MAEGNKLSMHPDSDHGLDVRILETTLLGEAMLAGIKRLGCGGGKIAQWVEPEDLCSSPGLTSWKERNDFHKFTSVFHTCCGSCETLFPQIK